jgi:hypothetical protein
VEICLSKSVYSAWAESGLQQRELLPVFTAFPFNRLALAAHGEPNAGAKVLINGAKTKGNKKTAQEGGSLFYYKLSTLNSRY